jgi:hypothetical protein
LHTAISTIKRRSALSVAIYELGITPETQIGLLRAAFRLRQAINELEHAAEAAPNRSDSEHRCLEAIQAAQESLFQVER